MHQKSVKREILQTKMKFYKKINALSLNNKENLDMGCIDFLS